MVLLGDGDEVTFPLGGSSCHQDRQGPYGLGENQERGGTTNLCNLLDDGAESDEVAIGATILFRNDDGKKSLLTEGLDQIPGEFSSGVDFCGPGLDDSLGGSRSSLPHHLSLFFNLLHRDILVEDRVGISCKK